MARGLEIRALDGVSTRSVAVSGVDLLHGSNVLDLRAGEGKRSSRVRVAEKFSQDDRAPNSPVCVIYYMLSSGGFAAACLQDIAKGGSSILGHPGQTCVMFQASTTRRPVHTLTTVEGLLPSFRHGLHGEVGMIFYTHVVYVVICSEPSSGSIGSVGIYRRVIFGK